jgi:hypothetical protein
VAANQANTTPNPNEEDLRADLHAMLAASRELGPDMDRSLVDSYLERQRGGSNGGTRAVASSQRQPGQPQPFGQLANLAAMGMLTAAYIAALAFSGGQLWWLIFVLMGIFGGFWGWWGHDEQEREHHMRRRIAHDEFRLRRHEMRNEFRARRHGYSLPEDTRPRDDDRRDDNRRDSTPDRQPSSPANTYD